MCFWRFLSNNFEKFVQILFKFSQQILVEGYEYVLAKFRWKWSFQSTKLCAISQTKGWTFGCILHLCTKYDRSIVCKNLDAHCCSLLFKPRSEQQWRLNFCTWYFYRILYTNVKYGQKVQNLFWLKSQIWLTERVVFSKTSPIQTCNLQLSAD